jgi:cytoskeletal protein CcmA (bactofilin family)
MGTLVADQVILRQTAATRTTFNASILVKGSLGCETNVDVSGTITGDSLFVKKNIYLKNKLYFGTNTPYDDSNETAAYIYGDESGIGINTKTPTSPFDITADDTISNILTVRSQTETNTNTIAQNNNNKAITVNASNASSFIGFYNDTQNINNNSPDAKLQYTASTISASGVLETISNIVKLSPNVYVYNRGTRSVTTTSIFDEPMIIYDSSQNNYLYEYYQNTNIKSGTGLTLAALNNNSNTFLRITTPNKLGLSIGGGANPYNNLLPMGTIGISDNGGNYYQNQMISRGTDLIKNKTTLGINTFSPKTNNYALDINGATRISNGEISIVTDLSYEIKKISFSKTYPLNGIAAGTSDSINSPFTQKISYTTDGGKTWNNSSINNNNLQITIHDFTVNYYDLSYALIGTSNSFVFYTRDKGINWNTVTLANDNFIRDIKTIYISNYVTADANRIFFAGLVGESTGVTPTKPTIFYYDIILNNVFNGTNIDISTKYISTTLADSRFIIKNSDGFGNFVYFVGNGIQKINITSNPPTSVYYINTTDKQYNSIYAYDNNFVVAVGIIIISYTRNGIDWTDITFTDISFNDVFIYDTSSAVAVGNNAVGNKGIFYYTSNGTSWASVPDTIINSSGIASLITNTNYKLSNIIMPNKDSYIISSIINPYDQNSSLGRTKMLYGYYPNLLNRTNNTVLELSGNIVISGDIEINDSGKLKTKQNTFNLLTENVETMYIANDSSNVNIGNYSTNTNINGKLITNNDTSLNSALYVGGITKLNSTLEVAGNATMNNRLTVVNDTALNSKLAVQGDVSLNSKLVVQGDVSLNSNLTVTNNALFKSRLEVDNDVSLNSNLTVNQTIYNSGILKTNNIDFYNNNNNDNEYILNIGNRYVQELNNNTRYIYIGYTGQTIRNKNVIYIGSDSNDEVRIKGNVIYEGPPNSTSTTNLSVEDRIIQLNDGATGAHQGRGSGLLFRDNDLNNSGFILLNNTESGYLIKPSTLNSNVVNMEINSMKLNSQTNTGLIVLKKLPDFSDASFNMVVENLDTSSILLRSTMSTSSNQIINTKLTLNNDASLNTNLFVNGITTLNNQLITNGDVSMNSQLFVNGDSSLNNVNIRGITRLNNQLITNGDVSMNTGLSVNGDSSFNNIHTNNLSSITALLNKLGIGINNILPNISLDVSGNFRITNGVVVQFYE